MVGKNVCRNFVSELTWSTLTGVMVMDASSLAAGTHVFFSFSK
jgi:hypothetical protein